MAPRIILSAVICLQLSSLAAFSVENTVIPPAISPCDSTQNQVNWLMSDLECSPQKTQLSLLANISRKEVKHSQIAGLANIATENVEGYQVAFALNYARRVQGAQIAWDINMAKTVNGLQLGSLNIADTVRGAQIGSINISNHIEGIGIGFLTLSHNGLLHLDISAEETGMNKLSFASGKTFFTSYALGYSITNKAHPYSFGLGFGYHKTISKSYLEAEFQGSLVLDRYTKLKNIDKHDHDSKDSNWRRNELMQFKVRVGHELFHNIGLYGGLTYNALITSGKERLLGSFDEVFTTHADDVYGWPGVEIGIRFGR